MNNPIYDYLFKILKQDQEIAMKKMFRSYVRKQLNPVLDQIADKLLSEWESHHEMTNIFMRKELNAIDYTFRVYPKENRAVSSPTKHAD